MTRASIFLLGSIMRTSFEDYSTDGFYDELFDEHASPRTGAELLIQQIRELPRGEMERRQGLCDGALVRMGVTFRAYGDDSGVDRPFPFDLIPRIIDAREWSTLEADLEQRVRALNLFNDDVYQERRIVAAGVVPRELVETAAGLRPPCTSGIHTISRDDSGRRRPCSRAWPMTR